MQLCTIYKSSKKADTYLYIEKNGEFDKVPDALRSMFGTPVLVMTIDLDKRTQLGQAELDKVKSELNEQGFYLQLPPPTVNMLDELKQQNGVED